MRRLLPLLFAAVACSPPTNAPAIRHLERPTDVSFACVGFSSTGATAFPPATCLEAAPGGDAGVPDAATGSRTQIAFVIEQLRGGVSVANVSLGAFLDSDRFTPGLNGIPVGRLPSSIATAANGCHVVVANSGSCDLSMVSVVNAVNAQRDSVSFVDVSSTAGRVLAQPTMVLAPPSMPIGTPPQDCSAPSGHAYLSYPGCNLVARVDLATGAILDGVRYRDGQPPEIVGADVTCPVECTGASAMLQGPQEGPDAGEPADAGVSDVDAGVVSPDAGTPPTGTLGRPVALAIEPDGSRLYVGARGSSDLLVVDLGADGAPTAVTQLPLEGAGGVSKVIASGDVAMGNSSQAGTFRFVYAIGADQAIHVADVTPGRAPRECDTQVDRRFLHAEESLRFLSCMPVGAPTTPPRRADARGPGVRLPNGIAPLDMTFLRGTLPLPPNEIQPQPQYLNGLFVVVTAVGPVADARLGRGLTYFINVDDDNYEDDVDNLGDVNGPDIALVMPHSLRDGNLGRRVPRSGCVEPSMRTAIVGPPRLLEPPQRQAGFLYADNGVPGDPFAPGLHRVPCDAQNVLWELQMFAPPEVHAELFADLERTAPRTVSAGTPSDETFGVTWEGPLAFSTIDARRTGGKVTIEDELSMTLRGPGALLCGLGMKTGDFVRFVGCTIDTDCALDETCVVHPEAPSGVNGMCFREERAADLTSVCRRLLTTQRNYTAIEVGTAHAVLVTRPVIFSATPVTGCTSAEQCTAIEEEVLADVEVRNELAPGSLPRHPFACQVDPYVGGPARCLFTCDSDAQCGSDAVCEAGRCVMGPIPPQECFDSLQRYEPRAGDEFVVTSSHGSFGHRMTMDPATGLCVEDEARSPLLQNRIGRVEPPCTDTTVMGVGPNPCQLVGMQEPYVTEETGVTLRPTYGMRLRGTGFSFDVTDVAYPLKTVPDVLVSTISTGFSFRFTLTGGFFPHTVALQAPFPERIRNSIDGSLWIVDSGDSVGGLTRGQLLILNTFGVLLENRFR